MNEQILDWIGYIASSIVLISLLMSSIKKLRWINLVGALVFGIYGFLIGSLPTGFMNVGIVVIDIYYLARIYLSGEYFKMLPIDNDSEYLTSFINFYKDEISLVTNLDKLDIDEAEIKLYILRNMTPAGVFICNKHSDDTLEIKLDYAIPQYRDFKLGVFLFEGQKDYFTERGFTKFIVFTEEKSHTKYLNKMGFIESKLNERTCFIKEL
jgi:hypothetical protein